MRASEDTPWTHRVCQPGLPLTDLRALADLPEPEIPVDTGLHTTFFRQALLRASAGCRVAAQARTLALLERAGHFQRVQIALESGKGTAAAAELAAMDVAAAELMGDDGSVEAQLAMRRYQRAARALRVRDSEFPADDAYAPEEHPVSPGEQGSGEGSGRDTSEALSEPAAPAAAGSSSGAAVPHARMFHGAHASGNHMFSLGPAADSAVHAVGGAWRAGSSVGSAAGKHPDGAPADGSAKQHACCGAMESGADPATAATSGPGPEIRTGPFAAVGVHRSAGRAGGIAVVHGHKGSSYAGVRNRAALAGGDAEEAGGADERRDGIMDFVPNADAVQPDGLTLSPDQGGISTSIRKFTTPAEPLHPALRGRRARQRPAAESVSADADTPAAESVWDLPGSGDEAAAEAPLQTQPAVEGEAESAASAMRRRGQQAGWKPRRLQEGAFAADMRDDLSASAIWSKGHNKLAAPHSRRDRTLRHAFPQYATGFHAVRPPRRRVPATARPCCNVCRQVPHCRLHFPAGHCAALIDIDRALLGWSYIAVTDTTAGA